MPDIKKHLIVCRMTWDEKNDVTAYAEFLGMSQDAFVQDACHHMVTQWSLDAPQIPALLWDIKSAPSRGEKLEVELSEDVYASFEVVHTKYGYSLADVLYTALIRTMRHGEQVRCIPLHVSSSLHREYKLRATIQELEHAIQWYMPSLSHETPAHPVHTPLKSARTALLRTYVTHDTYQVVQDRGDVPDLCERALQAYFEAHPRQNMVPDAPTKGVCRVELDERTYTVMRQIMILKRWDRLSDFCVNATTWWLHQDSRHIPYHAAPLQHGSEAMLRKLTIMVSPALHQAVARCFKHDQQRVHVAYYNVLLHYMTHILHTDDTMTWLKKTWSGQAT
jgi:hypothetical protein